MQGLENQGSHFLGLHYGTGWARWLFDQTAIGDAEEVGVQRVGEHLLEPDVFVCGQQFVPRIHPELVSGVAAIRHGVVVQDDAGVVQHNETEVALALGVLPAKGFPRRRQVRGERLAQRARDRIARRKSCRSSRSSRPSLAAAALAR